MVVQLVWDSSVGYGMFLLKCAFKISYEDKVWSSYKAWQQMKFNSSKDNHLSFTNTLWRDVYVGTLFISRSLFLISMVVISSF